MIYYMSVIKKSIFLSLLVALQVCSEKICAQALQTKEISQEVALQKGSLVRIVSNSGKLNVRSWDQAKVKVIVQFKYDSSQQSQSDEKMLEDIGISIKPFSNRVDILKKSSFAQGKIPGKPLSREPVFGKSIDGKLRENWGAAYAKSAMDQSGVQIMTVMVPAGSRLDVEHKFGDVVIGLDLDEAKFEISNGTLDAQNIKELNLISDYCNVNLGNVEKAEVEFYNGTFRAQNIKDLDLDAKSSNIEYEKGDYLYLRSQTDEIDIHEITKIDGRKVYGSIKVDQLNGSFDLEGTNVDIKFRNISSDVTLVKINNKYGDVRLPVKSLKNYFVDFTGYYSTVFAPFQKQVIKEDETKNASDPVELEKVAILKASQGFRPGSSVGELAPRRFTSAVGDTKAKHTRIELICNSCTVDFK